MGLGASVPFFEGKREDFANFSYKLRTSDTLGIIQPSLNQSTTPLLSGCLRNLS